MTNDAMTNDLFRILTWATLMAVMVWISRWSARRRARSARERRSSDLVALRAELAQGAVELARSEYNVTLDYSVESVRRVEAVLGQIHELYLRRGSEDGMKGLSLAFAAYIVTVIERHFGGGEWRRDHAEMGEGSWPYDWRGATLFPYEWCLKRIFDGPADDVWFKFQALVLGDGLAHEPMSASRPAPPPQRSIRVNSKR